MNIFTTAVNTMTHKFVLFGTDGWNNNPTAKQFQHTYKRLICHCGAEPGTTGNVSPLEDTTVLQVVPESAATDEDTVCMEEQCKYLELHEYTYATETHALLENIVCYIAGKFSFTLSSITTFILSIQ